MAVTEKPVQRSKTGLVYFVDDGAYPSPHCPHPQRVLVKRILGNGTRYYLQCTNCGDGESIAQAKLSRTDLQKCRAYSDAIREHWNAFYNEFVNQRCERQRQERQHQIEERNIEWWKRYNAYLQTPEWRARRKRALERDRYLCQGCQEKRATQVHHLTYAHVGNELLFELTSVCDDCHERVHQSPTIYVEGVHLYP